MHYSGENVPIPLSREYEKRLLEKIETIVKMDDMESIFYSCIANLTLILALSTRRKFSLRHTG